MSDYHLHLHPHEPRTVDAPPAGVYPPGHIEAYVEAAGARGVQELGFTEHLYRCAEAEAVLGSWWERDGATDLAEHTEAMVLADRNLSLESYVSAVQDAKDRGLPVLLGLEVDFFPETIEAVLELLEPYPWDYLIGSVHWVGSWSIDSSEVTHEFERRGIRRAWEDYFEVETLLAASGTVDVLGHVDVVKKYGIRPAHEPLDLYERVVDAAAAGGVAVEVSSQGLRKPVGEEYPAPALLAMFFEAGVPITLASDAHVPHEAGWGHDQLVAAACRAGYTERLRFAGRKATSVPL